MRLYVCTLGVVVVARIVYIGCGSGYYGHVHWMC